MTEESHDDRRLSHGLPLRIPAAGTDADLRGVSEDPSSSETLVLEEPSITENAKT